MKIDKPLTVALCVIAKDKESIISRMLDSTLGVFDLYCLQDTGSKDNTVKVFEDWCKKNGKEYKVSQRHLGLRGYKYVEVDGKRLLGDFAGARNDSFKLAKGCDYAFWLDTDDVLVGAQNIKPLINHMNQNGVHMALLTYIYAKGENGINQVVQKRERVIDIRRKGSWQDRVHETYMMEGQINAMEFDQTYVEHMRSTHEALSTSRRNNIIMTKQLEEEGLEKFSDKMLHNLAFDHWEHREFNESIKYYKILFKRMSGQPVSEALIGTVNKIAQCYLNLNKIDKAIVWALKSKKGAPNLAESYIILSQCYASIGSWAEAELYSKEVLRIGKPNTTAPINDYEYLILPRTILQQVAINRGDLEEGLRLAGEILSIIPSLQNKQVVFDLKEERLRQEAVKGIISLSKYLQATNQVKMLDRLKSAIPSELKDDNVVRGVLREITTDYKRKIESPKLEGSKSIVFYAGGHYEPWDGNSDKEKGIGGSEGMCIQLARELATLGNKVYVYNESGSNEPNVIDGVTYVHHSKWQDTIKCDVFVALRRPDVFNRLIRAKKQFLWLHDTEYGDHLESIHFYAPNKVIVLSEAHLDIIKSSHGIKDTSVFYMSRNALNKNAVKYADENKGERDPFKVIYASSYDRGLDVVLSNWPRIKEAIPEATLDIYYGWDTYNAFLEARKGTPHGKQMQEYKDKVMGMIGKLTPLGVTDMGRVSQNELYKRFGEAGFWYYPTGFYEISCITAMSAQAMGAIPICTNYAALVETVGQWGVKANQNELVDAMIYKMQNIKETEKERKPMMKWAREKYDITGLAKDWDNMMNVT